MWQTEGQKRGAKRARGRPMLLNQCSKEIIAPPRRGPHMVEVMPKLAGFGPTSPA